MSDHDELILQLSRLTDQVRESIDDLPDPWVPLHCVLPFEECDGFMFMGACRAAIIPSSRDFITADDAKAPPYWYERQVIFRYKHGITRRYLNLGLDLRPYYYVGNAEVGDENVYAHCIGGADRARQLEWAITCAFDGLEELGATRTTAYNAAYIADRNARLAAIGVTVIG